WKYPHVQALLRSFATADYIGLIELDRSVFGARLRTDVIAKVVKYERSWLEAGTEAVKSLSQMRGSTRKIAPQKGRGKARVGHNRAPQRRGGYRPHTAVPHDKSTDIQMKVYNSAIRVALSAKFAQGQLTVVDTLAMTEAAKEELRARLRALALEGKRVYFVYGSEQPLLRLVEAADMFEKGTPYGEAVPKNEKKLIVTSARHISVLPIMENEHLVLDKEAVEVLEEMYRIA
ncbi:ribosomal protein L4 domain-containing protein, partial [Blyttiomyces helicus]